MVVRKHIYPRGPIFLSRYMVPWRVFGGLFVLCRLRVTVEYQPTPLWPKANLDLAREGMELLMLEFGE